MKDQILIKLNGEYFRKSDLYALSPEKLRELLWGLNSGQIEDICDLDLRSGGGVGLSTEERLQTYIFHLVKLIRPFAYATRDDSLNELEKTFSIFYRNYVNQKRFITGRGLDNEYKEFTNSQIYKDKL
jgi:hypothetical protein